MIERTDRITANKVDAILILLPLIGWLEASCAFAENDVPAEVAARVLALPLERRQIRRDDDRPLATIKKA